MRPAAMLMLIPIAAFSQPLLEVDFDNVPEGTVREVRDALPGRWVINMDKKVFDVTSGFAHPPKARPDMQRALSCSGRRGWPAGDVYITWPKTVTEGCIEGRVLVYLPDGAVPVFVGLTRFNPANWQDVGPAAVMLCKRKEPAWQCGGFSVVCRPGWNYIRVIADLDKRLAYALIRQEDRDEEEIAAWEVPIETGGKELSLNALYLRTDLGYSKSQAYFADLKVQPTRAPELELSHLKADMTHVVAPGEAMDLGGVWEFLPVPGDTPPGELASPPAEADWRRVIVPAEHYPIMRAHGARRAWFRRMVHVPEGWAGRLVRVNFGLTRARADVFWNGKLVHTHWEGFSGYSVDVTALARPGEDNELAVLIHTHRILQHPDGPLYPLTWYWMYSTGNGICLPVHIEAVPPVHVADVFARPLVREGKLRLDVTLANRSDAFGGKEATVELELRARVFDGDVPALEFEPRDVSVARGGTLTESLEAEWPGARLWWPHDPHLYTAQVEVVPKDAGDDAPPLAARRTRFGFREIELRGPDFLLNGKRLYQRRQSLLPYMNRVLDPKWFRDYVATLRAEGYNCVRIHGAASELLARQADEMGFLIIPEFSIKAHNLDPAGDPGRFVRGVEHCLGIVREQRNHPSVLMWNISNEVYVYGIIRAEEQRDRLAHNLDIIGDLVQQADPTRTVGYDGDCDLAGRSPTANLHYPWHIFEIDHPMPVTRFWLDEARRPWMGYVWPKDKPLIVGEFYHAPYELRAPWGLTQFMGDRAFVHPDGWAEGVFRAYRWADEGLRHARAAGCNPWAVRDPVKKLGTLLRPVFIAVKETNRTFRSGERVERTVCVYNDVLLDRDHILRWALASGGERLAGKDIPLSIPAGGLSETTLTLHMPEVRRKTRARLELQLLLDGEPACEAETKDFAVFPRVTLGSRGVVVCGQEQLISALRDLGAQLAEAPDPTSALAQKPTVLVLAGAAVDGGRARHLLDWVEGGGRVVWLDAPPDSWLPAGLQVSEGHWAVHAFAAVGRHRVLAGLTDDDLKCWRPDGAVCRATLRKPHTGSALPILEAGGTSGLDWAPLVEVRRGSGCFLLCQMGLTTKAASEPAAARLLANLLRYRPEPETRAPVCAIGPGAAELRETIGKLGLETVETPDNASVLVLNVSSPEHLASDAARDAIVRAREGATLVVRGMTPEGAAELSRLVGFPIAIEPAKLFHLVRKGRPALLDGLSNGDFYWSRKELETAAPITEGTTPIAEHVLVLPDDSPCHAMTDPCTLATAPLGDGRLVLDQIRWAEATELEKVHAGRIGTRLLANLGARFQREDTAAKRTFAFVDLRAHANRGFHDKVKGDGKGGWTDEGIFDMRHFPVNRTGFDEHGNPMDKELFTPRIHCGGVDFGIIDPEANQGRSCIVLGSADPALKPGSAAVEVGRRADMLWLLHAADGYWNNNAAFEVANLRVRYADGEETVAPLVNTKHLHDWRVAASLSEGWIGWMGGNGRHAPCVLYVWGWRNPRPEQPIAAIEIESGEKYRYILVAATCETR